MKKPSSSALTEHRSLFILATKRLVKLAGAYTQPKVVVGQECHFLEIAFMKQHQTSVVIVGAGPAGLTLAHLLASYDIDTILLEKLSNTMEEPRAIGIDSETLRTMQAADLVTDIADDIYFDVRLTEYVNADGKLLFEFDTKGEQPYGFPIFNTFDQPGFDRTLATVMPRRKSVKLWFNHELKRFEQSAEGVTVYAQNADGEELKIEAQYLVGCDGGRSSVRAELDIEMTGDGNEFPWLVIDTIDPGFDKGFESRFFCDPSRPGMTIKKHNQQRRWEWMLMPGETPSDLLEDEMIRSLIAPYTDPSQVDIYRKRVYNFSAIVAERWQQGRVFLAGDAAHMTPPFAGQGLNSGMRDVRNLSWKLAMVIKGQSKADILETYEKERREHAKELIEFALNLGNQIQPIDPEKASERDAFFFELQKDKNATEDFAAGLTSSILARALDKGIVISPEDNSINGQLMYQPKVVLNDGSLELLDNLLGKGFSILGYNCDPAKELDADTLAYWQAYGTTTLAIRDEDFDPTHSAEGKAAKESNTAWAKDNTGYLAKHFQNGEQTMALVRPDKFCLVAFNAKDAREALAQAKDLLHLA